MANRKRKWGVAFTARGRGPCRLLGWLRHVRPRKVYQLPSPSDSSFSSSEVMGTSSSSLSLEVTGTSSSSSEVTGTSSSSSSLEVTGTRPSYPRPLIWGTRSIKQSEPWTCEVCGFKNELIHHLMFDLPPFNCKACDADPPEGSTDFGFCYGDLALNEFCPISNVKNQKGPTCIANALSSAVEITHRVMKIIREESLNGGPIVDVDDLLNKYKMWREEQVERSDKFDFESLIVMLCVVEEEGVKDMESDDLYKIQDWHDIDEGDFAALSSALADGYPLITGFQYGERLASLQPGEVYMPPNRKTCGHVTVLVGAQQERGVKFFYFLNSWSEKFCSTMSEGDGITGGIGAIRAGGIDFAPIQILRFRERRRQEVHHPEYFSL